MGRIRATYEGPRVLGREIFAHFIGLEFKGQDLTAKRA